MKNSFKVFFSYILLNILSVFFMWGLTFLSKSDNFAFLNLILRIFLSTLILYFFFLSGKSVMRIKKKKGLYMSYNMVIFIGLVIFLLSFAFNMFRMTVPIYEESYFLYNLYIQPQYFILKTLGLKYTPLSGLLSLILPLPFVLAGIFVKNNRRK